MNRLERIAENKELVRRWLAMFNTGDLTDSEAIAAEEYVEHAVAPFGRTEPGAVSGPTHLRETAEWLLAQFPDLEMTIEALIVEGALCAAMVASTGTNTGPLDGVIPPTGRAFASRQTHWFRISGGRIAEHWATRDDLTAMLQLGVLPSPARP